MKSTKSPEAASGATKPVKAAVQSSETSKPQIPPKKDEAKVAVAPKTATANKSVEEVAQVVEQSKPQQAPKKSSAKTADTTKSAAVKKPVKEPVQAAKEPKRPKAPIKTAAEITERSRRMPVSAEERQRMIEVAAYLRAEQRGFLPGYEAEDWLAAEMEVDRKLGLVAQAK
jgi:hypothetical protein